MAQAQIHTFHPAGGATSLRRRPEFALLTIVSLFP